MSMEVRLLKEQGFTIIAMGDFNSRVGRIPGLENNTPDTNRNSPMFFNFLEQINLLIINTFPISKGLFTRFQDSEYRTKSKSILDYGLIDDGSAHTVTSFVIDEKARYAAGSDHALLHCKIKFSRKAGISWRFQEAMHYNITDNTNYTSFKEELDAAMSNIGLCQFSELSTTQMLSIISENLNKAAYSCFGYKTNNKKKGRCLPQPVLDKIKRKNKLVQQLIEGEIRDPIVFLGVSREAESLKASIRCVVLSIYFDFLLQEC